MRNDPGPPCPARSSRGSTLGWALGILAGVAVGQMVLFVGLGGPVAGQNDGGDASPQADEWPNTLPESLPPLPDLPPTSPPSAPAPANPSTRTASMAATLPRTGSDDVILQPTPAPATPEPAAADMSPQLRQLLSAAIASRRSGDMPNAIAKLETARRLAGDHPRVLFEQAATLESMRVDDRALAIYEQLAALPGEEAGVFREIAQRRLDEGLRPDAAANTTGDLYIDGVREIRPPAADASRTVILHVDIHARPGAAIAPEAVFLSVEFFEQSGGETVRSLLPPGQPEWTSEPVDWNDQGVESVTIAYTPTEGDGLDNRPYLGYLVELYYQDTLLDASARPRFLSRYQVGRTGDASTPGPPGDLPTLGDGLLDDAPATP